jgi:hypothetical protein
MLLELIVETGQAMHLGRAQIPAGVLWNKRPCLLVCVPKKELPAAVLVRGLRKHLGYECPEPTSDVFTLGIPPDEDAALGKVGLFGDAKFTT